MKLVIAKLSYSSIYNFNLISDESDFHFSKYCQTLGLVLRLRVDFVLPLSQEQEEEEEEEEEEEPLTKIYQKGVY